MAILVNITYENWDYEACEAGETDDKGFLHENLELDFRDLVRMLKREYVECSCSPIRADVNTWFTSHETDFCTGEEKYKNLHYSRDNPPKNAKYWEWAIRAAFKGAK